MVPFFVVFFSDEEKCSSSLDTQPKGSPQQKTVYKSPPESLSTMSKPATHSVHTISVPHDSSCSSSTNVITERHKRHRKDSDTADKCEYSHKRSKHKKLKSQKAHKNKKHKKDKKLPRDKNRSAKPVMHTGWSELLSQNRGW